MGSDGSKKESSQQVDKLEWYEAKKEWFQHVEKLATAKRSIVVLGPSSVKAELLSFGNVFFVRALDNSTSGNGRLRIVPAPGDDKFVLEFNAGFGKWARFTATADELQDGRIVLKSVGCPGAHISLS